MQAKYNWCTGRYQENGRDVSWEDVKASNGFGEYASTVSVFLTQKYADDTKQKLKNDGTGGLTGELNYLIAASKGKSTCKIVQAEDENDAADQIEQIDQLIDNLFISSHGGEHYASFKIGNTIFNSENVVRSSTALDRIAKRIFHPTGLFKGLPLSTIIVASCYASDSENNGESLIQAVADKFNTVAIAPFKKCGMAHFDCDPKYKISNWKLFLPSKLTENSIRPINIYHVTFDKSARVHFDFVRE
jgi:hypothetical protein